MEKEEKAGKKLERRKPIIRTEVEATEEELEQIKREEEEGKEPYSFRIERARNKLVDKMSCPLYQYEEIFINFQKGKNNTENTIKYYRKVFRSIYRFLVYHCTTYNIYRDILNDSKIKDEAVLGSMLPLCALEATDFDSSYRYYILSVIHSNEQTLNNLFRGYRAIAYFAMERFILKM